MADRFSGVAVASRATDFPWTARFDSEDLTFEPGETKYVPLDVATHIIAQSTVLLRPVSAEHVRVLYRVLDAKEQAQYAREHGGAAWQPPAPLTYEEAHPVTGLDLDDLPQTHFDAEGNPLKAEVKHIGNPAGLFKGRVASGSTAGIPMDPQLRQELEAEGRGAHAPLAPALAKKFRAKHGELAEKVAATGLAGGDPGGAPA